MLFLSTALYQEAKPLIQALSLKQNHTHTRYSIFENEIATLIITGTGQLKSCAAITYLCMSYPITQQDLFINFGLCAGLCKATYGNTYVIHKLTHSVLGHNLYPDPLLAFSFPEASLITYDCPTTKAVNADETILGDMEGYSAMFAAQSFFLPHQIALFKVVSDLAGQLKVPRLSLDKVDVLLYDSAALMLSRLTTLGNHFCFFPPKKDTLSKDALLLLEEISELFCYTETMRHSMQQYFQYYTLTHDDLTEKVRAWLNTSDALCCHQKREGKQYDKALKQLLLKP